MRVFLSALTAIALSACASLSDRLETSLAAPGLDGTRWGLVVMTMDGRELIAIRPEERFQPASNTKLFTAAAAFHRLGDMTQPDPAMGASIRIVPRENEPPDLILVGGGDAMLLDAKDCVRDCLSGLVDTLLVQHVTEVSSITVDTSLYPYELWPPGWSHEDRITRSGAPVSALTINSNELRLVVKPGAEPGALAFAELTDNIPLFAIANDVRTVAAATGPDDIFVETFDGSGLLRVYGSIGIDSPVIERPVAVNEPGRTAALRLGNLLSERGIAVRHGGTAQTLRHVSAPGVAPESRTPLAGVEIGRLLPPPLVEDVTFLMKQSQNLHAELLLRRLGLVEGDGSREAGLKIVETMMAETGSPRWSWDLSDGSGMSVYNRVTPRAVAGLLYWTSGQPWAEAFRATLPVGGVDGTLRRRFAGTQLEGRVYAKTGTLTGVNALSGFMKTKSGRMLIFSAFANERPSGAGSAIAALDATLVEIAKTH